MSDRIIITLHSDGSVGIDEADFVKASEWCTFHDKGLCVGLVNGQGEMRDVFSHRCPMLLSQLDADEPFIATEGMK